MIVRKWGNSVGVILPNEVVKAEKLKENEKIVIDIKKRQIGKELMGLLKDWKKSPQSIKDESREGWS